MQSIDAIPDVSGAFDPAHHERRRAQGHLTACIASTLRVIAAAQAERQTPPVHAARRQLAAIYGATRLRRRLERDAAAG